VYYDLNMLSYLIAAFLIVPILPTIALAVAARKKLVPVLVRVTTRRDTRGTDRGSASK
jgi:hypothetical protein